eukprot:1871205-Prymnesium_polylepis.1
MAPQRRGRRAGPSAVGRGGRPAHEDDALCTGGVRAREAADQGDRDGPLRHLVRPHAPLRRAPHHPQDPRHHAGT